MKLIISKTKAARRPMARDMVTRTEEKKAEVTAPEAAEVEEAIGTVTAREDHIVMKVTVEERPPN